MCSMTEGESGQRLSSKYHGLLDWGHIHPEQAAVLERERGGERFD